MYFIRIHLVFSSKSLSVTFVRYSEIYIQNLWTWLHFNSNYLWYSSLIWCLLSMPELTESADRITDLVSTEHARTNWVSQFIFQFEVVWLVLVLVYLLLVLFLNALKYLKLIMLIISSLLWQNISVFLPNSGE